VIDWFTVVAQIINFLILVALLRYFLYGRILAAMDRRQQEISARWDEAQQQRAAAESEFEAARQKNRRLDDEREALLARVRDEVEDYRRQLTGQVRAEVDAVQSRWADAIREETDAFLRDLRRRAAEEICAIARRALADLAGADLEQQIVRRFLHKVEQLGQRERSAVIASLEADKRIAVVKTAHSLTGELQASIRAVLRERLLQDVAVQFEQSSDLLCGIALRTDSHTLAWNVRDYFLSLQQQLRSALEEETSTKRPRSPESADATHGSTCIDP
jgi:F-type H+-transporting ATPase subunit b